MDRDTNFLPHWIPSAPDTGKQPYQSEQEMLVDACTRAARDMEGILSSTAGIYIGGADKKAMRERIAQLREYVERCEAET